MIDPISAVIGLVVPLYVGYGAIYYKLGRIEGHLKLMNGGKLKK